MTAPTSGGPPLYRRTADGFQGSESTRAAWYPDGQSGGAVLALLGHVLEDVPTLAPMSLSRLTADIVRPVPLSRPLRVETAVVREGKRIQVVDLRVVTDEGVATHARALRVRDADLRTTAGAPALEAPQDPRAAAVPPPEDCTLLELSSTPGFLRLGMEMRRARVDGLAVAWVRLLVPVVEGEPVRASSRAAVPLDCANLLGVEPSLLESCSAVNPDVSGHLVRLPVGEWVGMTGGTTLDPRTGHGLSSAVLRDAQGPFGVTSTSQLLEPRPGAGPLPQQVSSATPRVAAPR